MKINITTEESQLGGFISWKRLATELFPAGGELLPGESVTHFNISERGINFYVKPPKPRFYDGPEHESLRAVWRCMIACFGLVEANRRLNAFLGYFKVQSHGELSPEGANYARKLLEKQLPFRGDYLG